MHAAPSSPVDFVRRGTCNKPTKSVCNAEGCRVEPSGKVLAVCISERKGTMKHPVSEVLLRAGHGIEGDAHAGPWHRQVSLLATESVEPMRAVLPELPAGAFAENILIEGLELKTLPIGTRLRVGGALLEVTQIGKECHKDCAIRQQIGDCVMPREGIFARVLTGGAARPGDPVTVE
ncbi:MAG: MOSC domain-containing protein [Clostridia bacterium]|nr:MAG: MOSC domain-containing protein [Clostridia bacterium]